MQIISSGFSQRSRSEWATRPALPGAAPPAGTPRAVQCTRYSLGAAPPFWAGTRGGEAVKHHKKGGSGGGKAGRPVWGVTVSTAPYEVMLGCSEDTRLHTARDGHGTVSDPQLRGDTGRRVLAKTQPTDREKFPRAKTHGEQVSTTAKAQRRRVSSNRLQALATPRRIPC